MTLLLTGSVRTEDWPEYRGKGRLGIWNETGIVDAFPEGGLKFTWRVPIRSGFAGPAVADGRVFVLDYQETPGSRTMDGTERLVCLDEETGKVLWTYEWRVTYRMLMATYAIGPQATPTVDGDRVYVVGATGMILCLKAETGELVWMKNAIEEYGLNVPVWGVASAALVDGDRVICIVGAERDGKVMAFNKYTGQEVWRALSSETSEIGYGTPIIYEAGGVRQLIIWHPQAISSLDPQTGKIYWEEPWEAPSGLTIAAPVKSGPYLFFTQFYSGSMMLRLSEDRPAATVVWTRRGKSELPADTEALHSLITTPIIIGDYIYGVDSYGELRALDFTRGDRIWTSAAMTVQARWGTAFMVRNGDRYYVNNDAGDLIIAQFTPQGYVEHSRTKLIEPTSSAGYGARKLYDRLVNWSYPAYANRHIVARNDREIVRASLAQDDY
jgi:outer membrane protein assembly factor BamB